MSASSSTAIMNPPIGIIITKKLSKNNHGVQVLTAIRGARLVGHLTGVATTPAAVNDGKEGDKIVKVANLAYEEWYTTDQQVLGFVLASLTKEVLPQVSAKETAAELWMAIEAMFMS